MRYFTKSLCLAFNKDNEIYNERYKEPYEYH
jgi:hypothetical protein